MAFQLINIGFGNMASASRIMAIISPESAPIKRMIQESRERGDLIDATYGRKTRSVLIMDSGQILLSAVQPETISHRLSERDSLIEKAMEKDEEDK
jgi:extracellular matrix regulatory protein A